MSTNDEIQSNARIADALRQQLGASVDRPAASGWIGGDELCEMLEGASPAALRRAGHALVAPEHLGFVVRRAGIGTPEKAYRRCDALLARECPGDRYEVAELTGERVRVVFRPAARRAPDPRFCSMRASMLSGIPELFGLPPARVRELSCAARGAAACRYQVRWSRFPTRGLRAGFIAGAAASTLALGWLHLAGQDLTIPSIVGALLVLAIGTALGRTFDLSRQLRAYESATARAPGLLEQAERALADKVDELARVDASLEASRNPDATRHARAEPAEHALATPADLAATSSREIHAISGGLQRGLSALQAELSDFDPASASEVEQLIQEGVARVGEFRAVGGRLARGARAAGGVGEPADLVAIARQAMATVRANHPDSLVIELSKGGAASVPCDPYQIEQVIVALLENAAAALGDCGRVEVSVRRSGPLCELVVADEGPGIDEDVLDQLFDPFAEPTRGRRQGTGLATCHRIVADHAGALRIESGPGTTVTVALPTPQP